MERNIHRDEFEQFLKDKADQYKVYPSDKIWSNINRSIHPRKKWPYAALTLFLLLGTAVFIDYNSFNYVVPGKLSFLTFNQTNKSNSPAILSSTSGQGKVEDKIIADPVENLSEPENSNKIIKSVSVDNKHHAGLSKISRLKEDNRSVDENNYTSKGITNTLPAQISDVSNTLHLFKNNINNSNNSTAREEKKDDENGSEVKTTTKKLWGGEVLKASKFRWQLSFSPTISYRRLTSGLGQITEVFRGVPYSTLQTKTPVNDLVAHKPAIGAEVGASLIYKLSDNFTLKGGVQLNYSRYQLSAYNTKPEIATLALHNNWGGTDSVNFVSTLKNYEGYGSSWLNNEYLQISLPIGFEWSVVGNSTLKWNVAASAQPVYNFANNTYLLSTDFKYYVQDPSLIRKWNINAGIETYVSYDMGSFKWQVGPQLRYQLMSSYKNAYPIKEYMVDFGFKIGVTKTLR